MATRITQAGSGAENNDNGFLKSIGNFFDPGIIAKPILGPVWGGLQPSTSLGRELLTGETFGEELSRRRTEDPSASRAGSYLKTLASPTTKTFSNAYNYWFGDPSLEGGASADAKAGYLQTLLGEGGGYDRAAEIEAAANDPRLTAELAAYNEMMARLRPEINQAKAAVSGAYGQAAGAGRTAAGNIGTRGESTAATYEDLYGRAATEAGDLAQGGGTMVSGLTGPGQAFQDIYGGAYGLGGTEAYGTRGTADIAAEGMQARAQQAAGAGSRAASNIENYWSKMTVREQGAFEAALRAKGYAKEDELKLKDQQVLQATGNIVGQYRDNKDERNRLRSMLGSTITNENYNTEIPRIMKQLAEKEGPTALLETMIAAGIYGGATGG
jgi:hypothetical protein